VSADDIDRQVTDHLARLAERDEALETVAEIAEQLALSAAQVRASMRRLASYGKVREAGAASSGGKTWTLTGTPDN
jgi:DNA-binding Lrp family transcriptional regulator